MGTLIAYRWEVRKLIAQRRNWLGVAAAAAVPIIFLISIQISKVTLHPPDGPYDTPLGTNLRQTGLALDLVVFKLIGVVGPTLIVALVAGDIVAGEDMGGTLKTILPRSLRRGEVLAGKALALLSYAAAVLAVFLVAGEVAGAIGWGFKPLVNLSGHELSALQALGLTIVAMAVYAVPVLAIASFGFFLSVVTRQSVAAIAGTLLYALALQGLSALSAIASARPFLLVDQFTAWHDLFQTPIAGDAVVRSLWVSAAFALPPLVAAWIVFARRDVTT
ncbi:MAG: type transport system permease protein [Solirubrobacteraceae bacterium]|jgi:ABC-2 type transport system permease protein|nr:type transport system permease protein [Solirubrobacteraceae bacterium]